MGLDFSNYLFRCSQLSKITGGTIGLTDIQKNELSTLQKRKMDAALGEVDEKGKAVKPLTDNMGLRLEELLSVSKNPELPKTMQTELRKIYRMERHKRNFPFTNQYVQKGIQQEEEAITFYQDFKNRNGLKYLFTKNTERLFNDWITGEPDLIEGRDIRKCKHGFDTKCSWSLDSFPFPEDPLDQIYEDQNQGYMWLSGADQWTTAYVLVNATEHQVHNEKLKWYYALQMPSNSDDKYWEEYQIKCAEVEKMMIYDYDRFVSEFPAHDMVISRDEWFGEGYDLTMEERVIEKTSVRDDERIKFFKERIKIGREYMANLHKQYQKN